MSTNHNAWTLTVHITKSVNKAAGKIDSKLYGTEVVPSKPPSPPAPKKNPLTFQDGAFILVLTVALAMACRWVWNRIDFAMWWGPRF